MPASPLPQGSVDIAFTYGDGVQFDALGQPVLVFDVPGNPAATNQRLYALMLTSARVVVDGVPRASADDKFHQSLGASLPVYVDSLWTNHLQAEIETAILQAVNNDPGVSSSPPATVSFSQQGSTIAITLAYTANDGKVYTLPSVLLQVQFA